MSEQEIIEGNKLIAIFMGFQETNLGWFDDEESLKLYYTCDNTFDNLLFHVSYDWLMPVVEKIESLVFPNDVFYNFNILGGCCVTIISSDIQEFGDFSEPTKLLSVYKAVIEFIKWYNSCQKEK